MGVTRIPEFIDSLKSAKTIDDGLSICQTEVDYLSDNGTLSTKKSWFTDYRNAIKQTFGDKSQFLKKFVLTKEESKQLKKAESTQVYSRHTEKRASKGTISGDDLILKSEELIQSNSYLNVALGLMLLTGRRATEILKTAKFEKIDSNTVLFSGQLKTKDSENAQTKPYAIPVLSDSDLIIASLARLRELRDFSMLTPDEVHSRCNKSLNENVRRHYGEIVPTPNVKNLRHLYAAINHSWNYEESDYLKSQFSIQAYIASILGHKKEDLVTANSYQDFIGMIAD